MSDAQQEFDRIARERLTEDLQLKVVGGAPRYAFRATGLIGFVPIIRMEGTDVIGYLWFSDAEDAAGYVADQRFSPESDNYGPIWAERYAAAKADGLTPAQAVSSFEGMDPDPAGRAIWAERAEIASLAELRARAGHVPRG